MKEARYALYAVIVIALLAWAAFRSGALDGWAIRRTRWLAQNQTNEHENTWYGVRIWQYPSDLMSYQQIVFETRPDFIIETGTAHGGLTLYLATLLEHINPDGRVLTVDIDPEPWGRSKAQVERQGQDALLRRIDFFAGSSTAPEILGQIKAAIGQRPGARVMAILDSRHTRAHVLDELELYSPLVTEGCYLIVNDTHFDDVTQGAIEGGPRQAVAEFMSQQSGDFEIDTSRDRFFITCSPSGFLKRVR